MRHSRAMEAQPATAGHVFARLQLADRTALRVAWRFVA
jgi:hypothetical protein